MFTLSLIIFLLCVAIYYLNKFKLVKNVAAFSGRLPVIGHAVHLFQVKDDWYSLITSIGQHCAQNRGISAYFIGPMPLYFIGNPEDATIILNKCLEKVFFYKYIEPLFGDTLVAAKGYVWKRNRKILDLAFKQKVLNGYMRVFNDQASQLVNKLMKKTDLGAVDISDDVIRNVLETTCKTTMGMRPDGEEFANDQYVKTLHKVFQVVTRRVQKVWLLSDTIFNYSSLKKELDDALSVITKVSEKMVNLRKTEHLMRLKCNKTADTENFQSFLEIVIENTVTESDSVFTDTQLRYLSDNILLAGFDTTTYELLFTLICIGSSEEVQDKIFDEIMQVVGEGEVKIEHLPKLVYLEAAIKEALRLYPIGPVAGREASTDVELSNQVTLPAGSSIIVHLWAINRNKKYWGKDADVYKPDRWIDTETLPSHPNAFASFSFGRRNCIGKSYAMMHLKATIVPIIKRFKITANHEDMDLDCYIMIKPKSGHLVKLYLRK